MLGRLRQHQLQPVHLVPCRPPHSTHQESLHWRCSGALRRTPTKLRAGKHSLRPRHVPALDRSTKRQFSKSTRRQKQACRSRTRYAELCMTPDCPQLEHLLHRAAHHSQVHSQIRALHSPPAFVPLAELGLSAKRSTGAAWSQLVQSPFAPFQCYNNPLPNLLLLGLCQGVCCCSLAPAWTFLMGVISDKTAPAV
jgi:hypothetical protein